MAKKKQAIATATTAAVPLSMPVSPPPTTPTSRAFDRGDYHTIRKLAAQGDAEAVSRLSLVTIEPAQLAVALGAIVVTLLLGALILRY